MSNRVLTRLLAAALLVPALAAMMGSASGQDVAATVSIEFLADRRCEVRAQGDGFRSHATYKPPSRTTGELRCAMPPVPKGRTIALTVTLPPDAERPVSSAPELVWSHPADRWVGGAQLTDWPDAVTISWSGRLPVLWMTGAGAAAILAVLTIRRRRARRRPRATSRGR